MSRLDVLWSLVVASWSWAIDWWLWLRRGQDEVWAEKMLRRKA
jgi:hypothetical protein